MKYGRVFLAFALTCALLLTSVAALAEDTQGFFSFTLSDPVLEMNVDGEVQTLDLTGLALQLQGSADVLQQRGLVDARLLVNGESALGAKIAADNQSMSFLLDGMDTALVAQMPEEIAAAMPVISEADVAAWTQFITELPSDPDVMAYLAGFADYAAMTQIEELDDVADYAFLLSTRDAKHTRATISEAQYDTFYDLMFKGLELAKVKMKDLPGVSEILGELDVAALRAEFDKSRIAQSATGDVYENDAGAANMDLTVDSTIDGKTTEIGVQLLFDASVENAFAGQMLVNVEGETLDISLSANPSEDVEDGDVVTGSILVYDENTPEDQVTSGVTFTYQPVAVDQGKADRINLAVGAAENTLYFELERHHDGDNHSKTVTVSGDVDGSSFELALHYDGVDQPDENDARTRTGELSGALSVNGQQLVSGKMNITYTLSRLPGDLTLDLTDKKTLDPTTATEAELNAYYESMGVTALTALGSLMQMPAISTLFVAALMSGT